MSDSAAPQGRALSVAGAVIAGGMGSRMGDGPPKAERLLGGSSLGSRAVGTLERALGGAPILYSMGVRMHKPRDVPSAATALADTDNDMGPLSGLVSCLASAKDRVDLLVMIPCDMPLLHPALLRALLDRASLDCVLTINEPSDERVSPFPSVWPTSLCERVSEMYAAGERSPRAAIAALNHTALSRHDLLCDPEVELVDPKLEGLEDIDSSDALGAFRDRAPKVRVMAGERLTVHTAWSLGDLAEALGITKPKDTVWVINGRPATFQPALPLFERDSISVL